MTIQIQIHTEVGNVETKETQCIKWQSEDKIIVETALEQPLKPVSDNNIHIIS